MAPKVVTAANVVRNEACLPACITAALALGEIMDPIDHDVLEGTLGWSFSFLNGLDWEAHTTLFCPLGF